MWQLHAQDFLLNFCVHTDFEPDPLFSTLKTKEPKALHTDTPMLYWSARERSRRGLPYSEDWPNILSTISPLHCKKILIVDFSVGVKKSEEMYGNVFKRA